MSRILAAFAPLAVLLATKAMAAPYRNYTYDADRNPHAEPHAYIPAGVMNGRDYGVGDFREPSDICMDGEGRLYIADTGNNRIVRVDAGGTNPQVIDGFDQDGRQTFSGPTGLFVTPENILYIADTGNRRVVALEPDGTLYKVIGVPVGNQIDEAFDYRPVKVAADFAERVYVVSRNCEHGIIQFDGRGEFLGFFGAVKTQTSPWDMFWRAIATEQQKESMSLIVPTEYSSIDIDEDGFVYGAVSTIDTTRQFDGTMFLHKLNPMGTDVKRYDRFPPAGDLLWIRDKESDMWEISRFADVAVHPYGLYSALDSYRGRVFTYDSNGDLLYIFGGMGDRLGQFGNPVAMSVTADHRFLILDNKYNQIVEFRPTEYGELINRAEEENARRRFDESEKLWQEALKYTARSELVLGKIGQAYMSQGDYETAMEYMKYAGDKANYSVSFENFRRLVMDRMFGPIMTAAVVLIAAYIVYKIVRKRRKGKGDAV